MTYQLWDGLLARHRLEACATSVNNQLSVEQLENLGEALLDFDSQADLVNWLNL